MTYSVVARDPETGAFGVAVQSHFFSTGAVVPWVEAGVGAVATQAFSELSYGPFGLERMRNGDSAGAALHALVANDAGESTRQVAMVDNAGRAAAHTGDRCVAHAGHRTGPGWSVQANMMLKDTVPDAMAEALAGTEGTFSDRLLAALDAAQAEGGDIRGQQSAAILISSIASDGRVAAGTVLRLHVEDHPHPLEELRRLVRVHRGTSCSVSASTTRRPATSSTSFPRSNRHSSSRPTAARSASGSAGSSRSREIPEGARCSTRCSPPTPDGASSSRGW